MSRRDSKIDSDAKPDLPAENIEHKASEQEAVAAKEKKEKHEGRTPGFVLFASVFVVGIIIGVFAAPSIEGNIVAGTKDIGVIAAANKIIEYVKLFPTVGSAVYAGEGNSTSLYYDIKIIVNVSGSTETVPLKISRDGKYFMQVSDVDETIKQLQLENQQPTQDQTQQPDASVTKSDKPVADVFIMSYCPYGLQMQKAVIPVMKLLGSKAEINIKWVSYAMHGQKEIDENTRQYCIEKEQSDKYIAYAECFTASGDAESCLATAGVDKAKLDTCTAAADKEFNITGLVNDKSTWAGGNYPPYMIDAAENVQFGVQGSPTFVLNGQEISVSRSPEAVKQAICSAFNTPPAECSTTLSTDQASAGIGGGTGSASDASCG